MFLQPRNYRRFFFNVTHLCSRRSTSYLFSSLPFFFLSLKGHPSPRLTWWRDHALLDASVDEVAGSEVTNELRLTDLGRADLHALLTCQASNNNLSVPASTSVKLDMHCESGSGFINNNSQRFTYSAEHS